MGAEKSGTISGPVCIGTELFLAALIPHPSPLLIRPAWCVQGGAVATYVTACVDFLSSGVCSPPARINRQAWAMMLAGAAFLKASWTRKGPRFCLKNKSCGEIVCSCVSDGDADVLRQQTTKTLVLKKLSSQTVC